MSRIVLAALMSLMVVGCGSSKSPEECVERCWRLLSEGDVEQAVELMDAAEEERELYCEIFREQIGSLMAAGGMVDFQVQSISEGVDEAMVEAVVVLKDGQRVEANYRLVRREKSWLICQ